MFYPRQKQWLALAERLEPELRRDLRRPAALVEAVRDRRAFQGWRMKPAGRPAELARRTLRPGESFTLDFGRNVVGHVSFDVEPVGPQDSPVRLRLVFAETPAYFVRRHPEIFRKKGSRR